MKRKFLDFIRENADRNDPVGDYCSDTLLIIGAGTVYEKILKTNRKRDFVTLLDVYMACQESREAFKAAWSEYRHG